MISRVLFSSRKHDWVTPQGFFDALNQEFDFTLDAAASPENAKCKTYFTIYDDALKQDWFGHVWLNPPYGRQIGRWVRKAYLEAQTNADLVVCLIPARTDTAYWHDWAMKGEIRFIRGRLKFDGSKSNSPFPSAVVIFRKPE